MIYQGLKFGKDTFNDEEGRFVKKKKIKCCNKKEQTKNNKAFPTLHRKYLKPTSSTTTLKLFIYCQTIEHTDIRSK